MSYRGKRLLCILLTFCLVLGLLPGIAGMARAASEAPAARRVFTEQDDAVLEEDVFAKNGGTSP